MNKLMMAMMICCGACCATVAAQAHGTTQAVLLEPMQAAPMEQTVVAAAADPGQVKDELLEGAERFAKDAIDVSEVNLDAKALGLVGGNTPEMAEMARKMDFVVVRDYTYDKPGMYRAEDVEAFRKRLLDGPWSCIVHTKDKSGTTDICTRQSTDHETNELVIISAEIKELTFVHIKGRMALADLGKMRGMMGGGAAGTAPPLKKH